MLGSSSNCLAFSFNKTAKYSWGSFYTCFWARISLFSFTHVFRRTFIYRLLYAWFSRGMNTLVIISYLFTEATIIFIRCTCLYPSTDEPTCKFTSFDINSSVILCYIFLMFSLKKINVKVAIAPVKYGFGYLILRSDIE